MAIFGAGKWCLGLLPARNNGCVGIERGIHRIRNESANRSTPEGTADPRTGIQGQFPGT